jgi:hypothetical protein
MLACNGRRNENLFENLMFTEELNQKGELENADQ